MWRLMRAAPGVLPQRPGGESTIIVWAGAGQENRHPARSSWYRPGCGAASAFGGVRRPSETA